MGKPLAESKQAAKQMFLGAGETVHCYPTSGPEHATDGGGDDCWCSPEFEYFDNGNRLAIRRLMN